MSNLSILIVVHNEETIEELPETISFADELIIILDKCTDNSEKLQENFLIEFSGSWNIEGDKALVLVSVNLTGYLK